MIQPLLVTAMSASVLMLIAWLWQLRSRNAGIVDVIWAYAVGGCGVFYAIQGSAPLAQRVILALISGIWFARLGTHLYKRVRSEAEDGRYQAVRRYFGKWVNIFHFCFFQLQALLVWLFSLPVWVAANNSNVISEAYIIAAVFIVIIAFTGETMADKQLSAFRAHPDNRGRTCREGLWRYSRHPNYFFEWLHWFAYPLLSLGSAYAAWVWCTPFLMLLFLYFITGIPYTEQQALRSRKNDYRDYQRVTSAFIPWRPKT